MKSLKNFQTGKNKRKKGDCKMETNKNNKKFHWVDDSVVIDFPVAKWIEDAMKQIEDCDLREDYMYFTLIDALWVDLKNWMAKGKISEAQWDHIMSRYPGQVFSV